MKRKVVQQGPSTMMISLPAKWVKEHDIQKGDDIDIVEQHGKLIVSRETGSDEVIKDWHSTDAGIFNEYFVNYFYQKGYDAVTIRYDDPKYTSLIEKRVRDLLGFEVIESDDTHTKIRMLVKIDEQEFENVLKKLFQITLVMGDKITEALRDKNMALLAEVKQDEKENNRYCDLCMRILYKNRYSYPDNGFAYFSLLRELEQIGDLYKFIADSLDVGVSADVVSLYNEVHQFFRMYYDLYYKYDHENVELFFSMKKILLDRCAFTITKSVKEEVIVIAHLQSLVHAVFNLKGPMFLQRV